MSSNAAKEWSGTFKELEQKRDKIKRQIYYYIKERKKSSIRIARVRMSDASAPSK
jgi:hypothetical protein